MFKRMKEKLTDCTSQLGSFLKPKCQRKKYKVLQERVDDQVRGTSYAKAEEEDNIQCHVTQQTRKAGPQFPMTPTDVFRDFGDLLDLQDFAEVMGYFEIWYLRKLIDESYQLNKRFTKNPFDHIAFRYEVLETLGTGSFGKVLKCFDHKTKDTVAVKVIKYFSGCIGEVEMLEYVQKKDKNNACNIVHMKEYFYFREHLCIVYELLGPALNELNKIQMFTEDDIRSTARDLVTCLKFLKKEKIVHSDLKPGNIMQRKEGQGLKVIDLGSSSFEHKKSPGLCSLSYCSPEVILENHFTSAQDMWSLGCILAELYTGEQLFCGCSCNDQIALMVEVLGVPPSSAFQKKSTSKYFYDSEGKLKELSTTEGRKITPGSVALKDLLNTDDLQFLNFIQRCLELTGVRDAQHDSVQLFIIYLHLHDRKDADR